MRLLAFSDLHRDRDQARRLASRAEDVDVVIAAGDFASFHLGLGGVIDALSTISRPCVLVPGNNESHDALWRGCGGWKSAFVLHGGSAEIDGVTFFGLGAGVPTTPFPWSFDLDEEEAAACLADCPRGSVLVSHSPPFGHVDCRRGRHLGSRAVLEAIERTSPRLVVCGHIHESWKQESWVGGTRVINLGPEGVELEV